MSGNVRNITYTNITIGAKPIDEDAMQSWRESRDLDCGLDASVMMSVQLVDDGDDALAWEISVSGDCVDTDGIPLNSFFSGEEDKSATQRLDATLEKLADRLGVSVDHLKTAVFCPDEFQDYGELHEFFGGGGRWEPINFIDDEEAGVSIDEAIDRGGLWVVATAEQAVEDESEGPEAPTDVGELWAIFEDLIGDEMSSAGSYVQRVFIPETSLGDAATGDWRGLR